ncbi:MAG: hypothetical protein JO256_00445 [Alphaproteobacteria bacterium]|nr:hypothetical protein [Alphaproteobacteria bacterium]
MTEEESSVEIGGESSGTGAGQAAVALGLAGASRVEADAFLRKQSRLLDLQIQDLHEQRRLLLSRLRLGRFSDWVKAVLQVMTGAVGIAVVVGLAIAMWKASQAEGVVVDTFSVPPRFSEAGISGQVIADDLTNKIALIRDRANTASSARSKDVRQNGDEIKIDIPETGVSLGQAWRYLRAWLGHERRLSGNVRLAGDGKIALSVALDGAGAATLSGAAGDLDKLEDQAAERIFQLEDPTNYVLYLSSTGRRDEALAAAAPHLQPSSTPGYRADAYALWANRTRQSGDPLLSIARARQGVAIDPHVVATHGEIIQSALTLGHDEEALQEVRTVAQGKDWFDPVWSNSNGTAAVVERSVTLADQLTGDFAHALSDPCIFARNCEATMPLQHAEDAARLHDIGRARDSLQQAMERETTLSRQTYQEALARARYFMHAAVSDWRAASADAREFVEAIGSGPPELAALRIKTQVAPLLAIALARAGDHAGAEATLAPTPADCYACLRARAIVAAGAGQVERSEYWFARAVQAAPSIPFAYSEWGAAVLARGKPDDAIAQFKLSNQKGPHFADPLEGWGEALMAKNQSHLALAKFAAAEKYAPNWGRLHLKWGEALTYAGKREEAKAHFARAAALDLAPAEKAELAKVAHG